MSTTTDTPTTDGEQLVSQLLATHGFDPSIRDGSVDAVPADGATTNGITLVDVHRLPERQQIDGYRIKLEVTQRNGEHRSTHKSWDDAHDRLEQLLTA